jgi:3-oxoadipyl-CoA thiolase
MVSGSGAQAACERLARACAPSLHVMDGSPALDAYLCDGVRTPFGRYGGALADVRADDLAAHAIRALLARHAPPLAAQLDEVVLGCANQAGEDNRNVARMALLLAGVPQTVPGITLNRLCASGLEAVVHAARSIRCGESELVLAGGIESMSRAPFVMAKPLAAYARDCALEDSTVGWRFINPAMQAAYGVDSNPQTAENLADELGISRADQDAYAWRSQQRAAAAIAGGVLAGEIAAVRRPARGGDDRVTAVDEHPRPDTTPAQLAGLKPIVRPGGSITAGNSSGVNDGSCALLLAGFAACAARGLRPLARVVSATAVGVAPRVMGAGPVPAIRKLLARTGLELDRIDVIEINEAFAAQVLACTRQLGLADDDPRVNPNGGAIALGHPLGASGARLVLTAARELQRRGGRHALVAMCVGVGQGVALLLERS